MTASLLERMSDMSNNRMNYNHVNHSINSERRISEDIASLDSWSEALTPEKEDSPVLSSSHRRHSSSKSHGKRKSKKSPGKNFDIDLDHKYYSTRYSGNDDPLVLSPARLVTSSGVGTPRTARREEQRLLSSGNYDSGFSSITNPTATTSYQADNSHHSQKFRAQDDPEQMTVTRPNQYYHNYRHETDTRPSSGGHPNAMYPNLTQFYHYREPFHQVSQPSDRPISKSYHPMSHRYDVLDSPSINSPSSHQLSYSAPILDSDDVDQAERMKNKLISVWNNVKYGWTLKTRTAFRYDSPIFLLGKCYHIRPDDEEPKPGAKVKSSPSIEQFKQDFSSRIWFTYRQDFPVISGTKFSTDCGWGCMLRSGQMMLAQALVTHYLGREWNVFHHQTREQDTYRKQIIRWFGDFPSDDSPFSIHRLVDVGKPLGKYPGDWYGPSSVAYIMRDAMGKAYDTQPILSDICVYVAQDCTIYKQDIYDMCTTRPRTSTRFSSSSVESDPGSSSTINSNKASAEEDWKRSVVIMVPVRLGGEELNPAYSPCIKNLLANDCCIGIIGGKPKHSLYFVGWQENKLIYLDPHYCQDAVDSRKRNFPLQTYHCLSPRKILVDKMDPSCTLGFYCRTKEDFFTFIKQTEEMVSPPKQKLSYPMFVFNEGRGTDLNFDSLSVEEERLLRIRHVKVDEFGKVRSSTVDSEEFVIL